MDFYVWVVNEPQADSDADTWALHVTYINGMLLCQEMFVILYITTFGHIHFFAAGLSKWLIDLNVITKLKFIYHLKPDQTSHIKVRRLLSVVDNR